MISEKGSIENNGSIRLLLAVHNNRHTGILYMKNEAVLKVLYFNRGKMVWAISNAGEDQLETVLIRHSVVNAEQLRLVKEGLSVNESMGKRLVENNFLSLDDLVRFTRIQLQQIVFSVLAWKQGGFQFVKDSPPQRLLSLDIDVTELVLAYIMKRIEMKSIWDELGSFKLVLVQSQDAELLERINLTSAQSELLSAFDGQKDLEAIAANYNANHRDSMLKVIFYLLTVGLLIRKNIEVPVKPTEKQFETIDTVSLLFADEKPSVETSPKDKYDFSPLPYVSSKKAASPDSDTDEADEEEDNENDELIGSLFPNKKRLNNWVYVLALGVLILGGTVLLMMTRGEKSQPMPVLKPEPQVVLPITTPEVKPEEVVKVETPTPVEPKPLAQAITSSPKVNEDKPVTEVPVKKPEPITKKPEPIQAAAQDGSGDPWELFRQGRLEAAGRIWARLIRTQGTSYSILLELDCQIESVKHAYGQLSDPSQMFVLNRRRGKSTCYLVLWGRFNDAAAAEAALLGLPAYFLKQANPPKVIALEPYL